MKTGCDTAVTFFMDQHQLVDQWLKTTILEGIELIETLKYLRSLWERGESNTGD